MNTDNELKEPGLLPPDDYCAGRDCRACSNPSGNCTCYCHAPKQELDESGDYAACRYCGELWSNDMLRDDKLLPQHNFGYFLARCAGSGEFPVAPTMAHVRAWKSSQQKVSD